MYVYDSPIFVCLALGFSQSQFMWAEVGTDCPKTIWPDDSWSDMDGTAALLCTFPYSNPGPNPLTLKPPCALKIDTKTASNGQRKNIQAFHSLSNNKKSTQKKQQHQLFSQETKNPPNTRKTPPSNKPTYGPTNISHSENCHGTRCRLRIWTWRHGTSRSSCWEGRR